ncbi:MAG TPA: ABC transporter ATP-binding protein, partial [Clostridiales bacterium]|nr:ABC transporter ATP-binding protein [Clostridiales bacterium]
LDETDSGLDVDAVRTVSQGIKAYKEKYGGTLIIITHNAAILEALDVDRTHILVKGRIVESGDGDLTYKINKDGFERYTDG